MPVYQKYNYDKGSGFCLCNTSLNTYITIIYKVIGKKRKCTVIENSKTKK